jgi:serine/threonine protein kinase
MLLKKFGRYKIIRELGQGGMAEVYEAHDPKMNRPVALKIIRKNFSQDKRFNQRFRNEAEIIANLEHRAILPVYDFGEEEKTGELFLVMRLMPDVLNFRIERDGPIPLEETSLILNRLAAALTRAHARGIVHRDIKPANILLDSDGTTFLSDFGLAAFAAKIETSYLPSSYGGSPFYMAPEQWLDEKVGPHTDIYQLGVTLFEMLTGKRPFPETDIQVLLERHVNGRIPEACEINPKLPRNIEPILARAMAKNPLDRYATPLELADAMARLLRPEKIKNRYEIREELQHGRLAVVYLAHDLFEDQAVALKIMKHKLIRNQAFQHRFQREKQMILGIQGTAVVPVYDMDQHNGQPYLAMRFMEGASLRQRFRRERIFSVEAVYQMAARLAEGLDAVHDAQKTHGDINLGNVLLDGEGDCYLTDFHITALAELTEAVLDQETPLGYLPYLAPEQWRGEAVTPQTDVYQFGVMLFELLTGQRPFLETAVEKLRDCIENSGPPLATTINSELPPQFDAILARAMARRPEDRFAKASELVNRLNQALESHQFETLKREGDDSYEAKQWDNAISLYNQALEIRPESQAVYDALDRAQRRKLDSGIFYQSKLAIEEKRWNDAAYFLEKASPSSEKRDMVDFVERKIRARQAYEAGRAAMQRQEWVVAQNFFDQADLLETNYQGVNQLLGQVAEKIDEVFQQAQAAIEQEAYDKALTLLSFVEGHETAVALREEIAAKQRQTRRNRWRGLFLHYKKAALVFGSGIAVVGLLAYLVLNIWARPDDELTVAEGMQCVETAVPQLRLTGEDDFALILLQGVPGIVPDELQTVRLEVLWEAGLPECEEFLVGDGRLTATIDPDFGQFAPEERWQGVYHRLDLSEKSDRIIVNLLLENQPIALPFLVNFEP